MTHKQKLAARKVIKSFLKQARQHLRVAQSSVRMYEKKLAQLCKMRPGGGGPKGKSFEREVAKEVVATFKDFGITGKDCYRTPLSGGHRQARKTDPGDLVISRRLRKVFPYHVECKSYKEVHLERFLAPVKHWKPSWQEAQWMKQLNNDCVKGLVPMLVFKQNNGAAYVAVPDRLPNPVVLRPCLSFTYNNEVWRIVLFSRFLKSAYKIIEGG